MFCVCIETESARIRVNIFGKCEWSVDREGSFLRIRESGFLHVKVLGARSALGGRNAGIWLDDRVIKNYFNISDFFPTCQASTELEGFLI